jgi:signal transduction histidine kinase
MLRVLGCITTEHDIRFVVLAGILCLFACWTAMSLMARARASAGRVRAFWIVGAAVVFGSGIWGTHFVAMLAYSPGLPVGYDVTLTSLSIVIAVVLSAAGFAVALRTGFAALGLAIAGAAIGAMHYTGMAALKGPFLQVWSFGYVTASILIGIGLAALAGQSAVTIRNFRGRALAASLLALGICGMHFTAMTALTLYPDPTVAYTGAVLDPASLGVAVAAVAILIVALGFVGALVDSHLASRAAMEAQRLRTYIAELETTKSELEATTKHLRAALHSAALANQAKAQFLATMSHELRTPLNAVIGFSEMLGAEIFGPLGDPRYVGYVEDIRASGAHLLGLINDILDLSRLDAGQPLAEEELNLQDLIAETVRMVRGHADAARLQLTQRIDDNLPLVRVDRRRMRQVLINLLSNAIKFTPADGRIQVAAGRRGSDIAICITDTGIGIAEENMGRVFERFAQVDSTLARKYEGAGLGLPICKRIVEAHGGRLEMQSEPNAGTTVTIVIPAERVLTRQRHAA